MNHLFEPDTEAKAGDPDAIYYYGVALWHFEGNYSDEVHKWFLKASTEGDPESLYQSGIKTRNEWDYGDELAKERQFLLSAAVKGHAKSCMALCELEFTCGNPDWGFNWYRRGRDLGHPHDVRALMIPCPTFNKDFCVSVGADEFELFLRQRGEDLGHYPENHISAYVWLTFEDYNLKFIHRLSAVLEQPELDKARILAKEYEEFLKTRPKRKYGKGI